MMATDLDDTCTICTNTYDLGRRQSVVLPCGHDFCLSCLVRLKASRNCQCSICRRNCPCPICRRNWAGFDVSALPGMEILVAALQLVMGGKWVVDNRNIEAALLALDDRQPSVLRLVARDDAREALPVAALAGAAKGCIVGAIFVDTFYSAANTAQDEERLQHLTENKSLRLTEFYGHLDEENMSTLPSTINQLGLAIGSAAGAAAVSGLCPWERLNVLDVSVSSRVAAEDLKPLPSVANKAVYFPFLSDAGVDSVRPAIEALLPDLRLYYLYFPKSQLTAAGARRLTQRLRGVTIVCVVIEASGTWQPGAEEKKSLEAELRSATGCYVVRWAINWC